MTSNSSGCICPNCGGTEIEQHDASGASICTACGVVVEENAIVNSIEFVEGAGGVSSVMGQFVGSNNSSRPTTKGSTAGGRYGFGRYSREITLAHGRRRLQDLASRLRLGHHFIECAHKFYTKAVEMNFTQGRKSAHVTAACLYVACRLEKSQHMLIDFSDALQVNVYTLGTTFLKFRRLMGLRLELLDPALYVYRFAAHLDLDDKANAVSLTALRLVSRMNRDWIVAGRRPAGVCAAALLIASRAHGFTRDHQDVTRILRVCGMTVQERVRDFECTPSANLTLEQFKTMDFLEGEADPPVFTKNRIMEARALAIENQNLALLESGHLDDPRKTILHNSSHTTTTNNNNDDTVPKKKKKKNDPSLTRATRWRHPRNLKLSEHKMGLKKIYGKLEVEMERNHNCEEDTDNDDDDNNDDDNDQECHPDTDKAKPLHPSSKSTIPQNTKSNTSDNKNNNNNNNNNKNNNSNAKNDTNNTQLMYHPHHNLQLTIKEPELSHFQYPLGNNGKALVLPNQATQEELQKSTQKPEDKLNLDQWKTEIPKEIVHEVDDLFRDDDEVREKEAIFNKINADYIEKQNKKEKDRLDAESQKREKDQLDAVQEEERARYLNRKRGRFHANAASGSSKLFKEDGDDGNDNDDDANLDIDPLDDLSTRDALLATVSSRKISRKINYDALGMIFDDDGKFSTEFLEDNEPVKEGLMESMMDTSSYEVV